MFLKPLQIKTFDYFLLNFSALAWPKSPSNSAIKIELSKRRLYSFLFLIFLIFVTELLTIKSSRLTGELNFAEEFVGITWLGPAAYHLKQLSYFLL